MLDYSDVESILMHLKDLNTCLENRLHKEVVRRLVCRELIREAKRTKKLAKMFKIRCMEASLFR